MNKDMAYPLNGTILWVEDTGEEGLPVIFCLHSLFLGGTMFDALVAAAAGSYRIVRPDFRAQGGSAPATGRSVTMDDCAEDMLALIDAMGLRDLHLVGASMGGDVAGRMAARRPELFKSLVFMGSSVCAEPEAQAAELTAWLEGLRDTWFTGDNLAMLSTIMFGETTRGRPDADTRIGPWIDSFRHLRRSIWPAMVGVVERPDITSELGAITAPTLIYSGADDPVRPPAWSKQIAEGVPGARQIVLDGVGHSPILEAQEIVVPGLMDFIAGIEAK